MTREAILIGIGILVALSPWSGLPLAWLTWFLLPAGLLVAVIAYTLYRRVRERNVPSIVVTGPQDPPSMGAF